MANNGNTTGKRDRALNKKRKAEEKRSRKRERNEAKGTGAVGGSPMGSSRADAEVENTDQAGE